MNKNKLTISILALAIMILSAGPLFAWGESNPRAMAMGGAYTALSEGVEASAYNPANLGLSTDHTFSLDLFSVGINFKNNSFSLSDYNSYTGQFLTDEDKEDILAKIPAEGLKVNFLTEAAGLNFSVWRLAFNFRGFGASKFNLDKDPFELLFYGNAVKSDIVLNDTRGEAFAVADGSISYGHPLLKWQSGELAVGASLHYLHGIVHEKITYAQGSVIASEDVLEGSAMMKVRSALGGSGSAFDIGASIIFEDNWRFSVAWQNFYSKINWNKDTEEMVFTFNMDPSTIWDLTDGDKADSLIEASDTTYSIDGFSTTLPSVIKFGLARSYRKLTWAIDWEQGVSNGASQAVTPRLATGLEYRPINVFPLRVGLSFGGDRGTIYSTGFGIYMGPTRLDLAIANNGSFKPGNTKGAVFALSMGLRF